MLATVGAMLGGSAIAQRTGLVGALFEHARERRIKVASDDPQMTLIHEPGDYRFTFPFEGVAREYLVHVPKGYRGFPMPLLMALHGGGGDADFQADDARYRLISKSEQAGFIAVFPNGYSPRESGVLATWNAGACCGAAQKHDVDDVRFLREVIIPVERQVRIASDRVFVTGMSNGGLMSWRMACESADLVRGIAPVEGTDNTRTCNPVRPVAVIEFHALDDDHIPFAGGRGVSALTDTNFVSVADTQAKWTLLDRAAPTATRVLSVPGAHCDLRSAKTGGAPVELCVTNSGGHSWPGGGLQHGREQPSMAINANDLMWTFFSSL